MYPTENPIEWFQAFIQMNRFLILSSFPWSIPLLSIALLFIVPRLVDRLTGVTLEGGNKFTREIHRIMGPLAGAGCAAGIIFGAEWVYSLVM